MRLLIVLENLKRGEYEDAAKFLEEMCAKGFYIDLSTLALVGDFLYEKERSPAQYKMIQHVVTYSLTRGVSENELIKEAKELLLKMQEESILPDRNVFVQENRKYEDAEKVLALYKMIQKLAASRLVTRKFREIHGF